MRTSTKLTQLTLLGLILFTACGRNDDPTPIIPPSDGNSMTLEGGEGESDAINAVYVDLSAENQSAIKRDSWSLGFYAGEDFRVILNNQHALAAVPTTETDIAAVNATNVDLSKLAYDYTPDKLANYDDTTGQVNKTVIGAVSANQEENLVYIINTVHGSQVEAANVWKIKVNRSSDGGYALQYGLLGDSEVQTLTIAKDADYNFVFASFSAGEVKVEPKKNEWDFVWNKSIFYTTMGTTAIPYQYSDLVFTNHLAGVSAAEVIFLNEGGQSNGKPSYEEFDESHLSSTTLIGSRNVIGSHWRVTTGGVGVLQDRFYVIKDQAGNIYKLKFLVMGVDDSGKRGYPELEYQLVKSN